MIVYIILKVWVFGLSLCILMLWFVLYLMKNIDMVDIVYVVYDKRNIMYFYMMFNFVWLCDMGCYFCVCIGVK